LTNARVCPSKLCWLVPSTKRNRKTSNCVRSLTDDAITATRTHRAPEHTNEKTTTRDGWVAVVQFGGVGCERGDPEERCCGSWHFSLSPNTHTHSNRCTHTNIRGVVLTLLDLLPWKTGRQRHRTPSCEPSRGCAGVFLPTGACWPRQLGLPWLGHPSRFWNFTTENSLT
jgi:hypothetical protein